MLKQSWMRPATMPMDAYRHDNHLVIAFDVPGVDREDIEVTVENNTLKVVSRRPRHNAPDAEADGPGADGIVWLTSERPHGTSTCQLHLGDGVDLDALEATCDHGVLTITVPLIESAQRRVEVTTGSRPVESVEAPAAA
jgi:HSP20 family protein